MDSWNIPSGALRTSVVSFCSIFNITSQTPRFILSLLKEKSWIRRMTNELTIVIKMEKGETEELQEEVRPFEYHHLLLAEYLQGGSRRDCKAQRIWTCPSEKCFLGLQNFRIWKAFKTSIVSRCG